MIPSHHWVGEGAGMGSGMDRRRFLVGAMAAGAALGMGAAGQASAATLGTQDWMAGLADSTPSSA